MNESTNVGQSTVAGAADAGAAAGALSFSASREHPASIAMTSSPEAARGMEVRILDLLKTLVEADRNRVSRAWRDGGPVRLHMLHRAIASRHVTRNSSCQPRETR